MTPKSRARAGELGKRLGLLAKMAGEVKKAETHERADILLATVEKHLKAIAIETDSLRASINLEEPTDGSAH